ncbi:MAG: CHAD domain-containing protein [Anaerolineae bacterium]
MGKSTADRIEDLKSSSAPVLSQDIMAEAGRKVLLVEFIKLLEHEEGSRTGEDIEDVHDMRVAIRRIRSAFRLLRPYFKRSTLRRFNAELSQLGWTLGEVRDLDVLIEDMRDYQRKLKALQQASLQEVVDVLDAERVTARTALVKTLDSRAYRRFVKDFSKFVVTSGEGAKSLAEDGVLPSQVRHILPAMIYSRMAAVRAYETVVDAADAPIFHALRIELKRLRYTVSLFQGVLGTQIDDFIEELKSLQDCLGHMNDVATARARLSLLLEGHPVEVLNMYLKYLEKKEAASHSSFLELWSNFNSRRVQQKLATALLALR